MKPIGMTVAEQLKFRQEQEARNGAIEARMKRIDARRFTGELPTDFGAFVDLDCTSLDRRSAVCERGLA